MSGHGTTVCDLARWLATRVAVYVADRRDVSACVGQLAMEPEGDRVQGCLVAASSAYGHDGS